VSQTAPTKTVQKLLDRHAKLREQHADAYAAVETADAPRARHPQIGGSMSRRSMSRCAALHPPGGTSRALRAYLAPALVAAQRAV
jgi:hypothetical protein